ncbi:MAG: helix-hairpin-helix domain-containing protein [Longimicrobiales bacterium]|nr:helix-hairpin-helix domain-containing protein [Longimicrobiales bacterium]
MTPRERRTFLIASLILLLASGIRYAHESRAREPLLPTDSAGVGAALLEGTREARTEAERRSQPLGEDERIDPNRAPPPELDRLPGVGPAVADRIVAERTENGPFRSAADLNRVRGIGPATVARLEPHLDFSTPPPVTAPLPRPRLHAGPSETRPLGQAREAPPGASPSNRPPVDLNRATTEELQTLRGVGPVIAERILDLRQEKGRFRSVDDLLEVRGIGPATLERVRGRVRTGP